MTSAALSPQAAGTGPDRAGWGASEVTVTLHRAPALDRVTLAIPAGQVTAVVGGDGAGKTTLLRCLAGALAPDSGQISVPAASRIGYLSASSGIYPDLTVSENLAFRAEAYGLRAAAARERTAELVRRAGLAEVTGRLAGQLSGGMRQKLGVIAAMLHQPDLLILDEPTTGVDPVSRSGLWWLITRAAADGAAVVFATTYLDEAERAGSVLVLDAGRALAAGPAGEIAAAMPGSLRTAVAGPTGPPGAPGASRAGGPPVLRPGERAWRRAGRWRIWAPPGLPAAAGSPVTADLQDAVTVAALAAEPAPPATAAGPAGPDAPAGGAAGPAGDLAAPAGGAAGPAGDLAAPAGGAAGPARDLGGPAGGSSVPAALARCSAVTRRFGDFTAVRGVDLEVRPGEIVGLLGANGAGKTTLIRMLLGLLGTSAGEVALFGQRPSRATRRRLGYLPQGLGLYDDLTAAENLEFSAAVFGGQAARAASPEVTAAAGHRLVGGLPLGLQRRVAFAQALAHGPELLILDEPTSGVGPLSRARLWDTIRAAADAGAGVLVTTHYMEEASECGRLVVMADGAVVAAGTAAQIVGDAQVTVVQAPSWAGAFARLEQAGLPVALAGRALRVPGAGPDEVARVLTSGSAAGQPGDYRISQAPAMLEERFFQLVAPAGS